MISFFYNQLVYPRVVYPLYHYAKRDGANRARRELSRSQWLDRQSLQVLAQDKLQRLLEFAYQNVPYYREVFHRSGIALDQLSTPEAFRQLPPLTKNDIRESLDEMVSTKLHGNHLIANSTSGSTGEPMRFYHDTRSNAYRKAGEIRGKEMTGFRFGEREVKLWGSPIDESSATNLFGRAHGRLTNLRFLSSYELAPRQMDQYIELMRRFKPVLMVSYPSALETFANYCREKQVTGDLVKLILTSAETLFPHQRELFETQFGAEVFNRYGCREVSDIAQECVAHNGLHVSADRVMVEIVDEHGQLCKPGQPGEVLVTDLDNYAMPFIRYRIGDSATWSEEKRCPCGRGLPLLAAVEGRSMDAVKSREGSTLGGTFWTILFRARPGIKQFQVVQDSIDGINVSFVRGDGFEPAALDYFTLKIREKCGPNFNVDYQEVPSIPNQQSGKRRLVISAC